MFRRLIPLVLLCLAGCTATTRNFEGDYHALVTSAVRIDGYAPFAVADLPAEKRLMVRLNILAQVFAPLTDGFVLLGLSNGIPSQAAHERAALAWLAGDGRRGCALSDPAISPNGRAYEFRYACAG